MVRSTGRRRDSQVVLVADSPAEGWISMDLYAEEVARALSAQGATEFEVLRPPVRRVSGALRRKLQRFIDRYVLLPRSVRESDSRLVHILDHAYAHLVRDARPRPVVITCHDLTPFTESHYTSPGWLLFRFVAAPQIRRADRVIAISEATRSELIRRLAVDPERITVAYHGVDPAFFEVRWSGPQSPITILHVGANVDYKRPWLVVNAAIELARRGHPVQFWKAGGTLAKDSAAQLTQAGITVKVVGRVASRELASLYAQASFLVFPSSSEGFGRPVAEAMAVGLPVVASGIAVLRETTGGNAIHVESADGAAYADAIEAAAGDHLLMARLSERGRTYAERYTWEEHARRLRQVYSDL